jgi:hypothetical protein
MDQDILYHLALGSGSHDLQEMFGDVKVMQFTILFVHSTFRKKSEFIISRKELTTLNDSKSGAKIHNKTIPTKSKANMLRQDYFILLVSLWLWFWRCVYYYYLNYCVTACMTHICFAFVLTTKLCRKYPGKQSCRTSPCCANIR